MPKAASPPANVLAEMTDFMLIRIYPALITQREVRSEHPAFNAMGWQAPTPVCPCLLLPAGIGAGAAHTATAQGTGRGTLQGGISQGTWHPCPCCGVPQRCMGGYQLSGTLRCCRAGHGWWSTWLSFGCVRPCHAVPHCAILCHATSWCAHQPRLRQSSQHPTPAARLAHTAL